MFTDPHTLKGQRFIEYSQPANRNVEMKAIAENGEPFSGKPSERNR
jgi:hypothetical protein